MEGVGVSAVGRILRRSAMSSGMSSGKRDLFAGVAYSMIGEEEGPVVELQVGGLGCPCGVSLWLAVT